MNKAIKVSLYLLGLFGDLYKSRWSLSALLFVFLIVVLSIRSKWEVISILHILTTQPARIVSRYAGSLQPISQWETVINQQVVAMVYLIIIYTRMSQPLSRYQKNSSN